MDTGEQDAGDTGYFLALNGIPGNSAAVGHAGEIDIASFSWGLTNTATGGGGGGGGGAGRATFRDLSFVARTGIASPLLFQACAAGRHLPTAVLTGERAPNRFRYLRITLSEVIVTGYQQTGSESEAAPIDAFSLGYERIEVTHIPQRPDGSAGTAVTRSWNLRTNTP
jgi:type VI secretion system secreted protein Hcp